MTFVDKAKVDSLDWRGISRAMQRYSFRLCLIGFPYLLCLAALKEQISLNTLVTGIDLIIPALVTVVIWSFFWAAFTTWLTQRTWKGEPFEKEALVKHFVKIVRLSALIFLLVSSIILLAALPHLAFRSALVAVVIWSVLVFIPYFYMFHSPSKLQQVLGEAHSKKKHSVSIT